MQLPDELLMQAGRREGDTLSIFQDESRDLIIRRGFANWATSNGWDLKTLMEYVGWRNVQSAMRYVEAADPFSRNRIERTLQLNVPVSRLTNDK